MYDSWRWTPRPTVAQQRREAELAKSRLTKSGLVLAPVVIVGRKIATTFWGTAWCTNLESYSDYANRLPRGRSYARNGSVLHLEIAGGSIAALVQGSAQYKVSINIAAVQKAQWKSICSDSSGAIDSLVELLQGRFSKTIMERISRQHTGLFPSPKEIKFTCSCPDMASMCKHVAAVLYGVGARLDAQPELIFALRQVDEKDLISSTEGGKRLTTRAPSKAKLLTDANLSELFGLHMGAHEISGAPKKAARGESGAAKGTRSKKTTPAKKTARGKAVKKSKRPVARRKQP